MAQHIEQSNSQVKGATRKRLARAALILAPLLAVAACDQVTKIWEQIQPKPGVEGPVTMASVAPDARTIGGVIRPLAEMDASLKVEPLEYVPGELIVGAKVEEEIAQAQGLTMRAFKNMLAGEDVPAVEALELAPGVLEKATQDALGDATKNARIVLDRLKVEGTVEAGPGGVIKIDLSAAAVSPTRWQTTEPAPIPAASPDAAPAAAPGAPPAQAPAAPAQPGAAPATPGAEVLAVEVDPNLRCPRGVTEAQLDADIELKTQCALERLRASKQFAFVEKNYVATLGFERAPWSKKPAQPPATNGQTPAQPGQPTTGQPAPTPGADQVFTGSLPNDPLLPLQWHFRGRGAGVDQAPGGAGFEPFWAAMRQVGRKDIRVAVIDTGIDYNHPDFKAGTPNNLGPGIDMITSFNRAGDNDGIDANPNDEGDADPSCGVMSNTYHGSHVSGTVGAAATNKARGVSGANWNVTVVPVRALGKCGGSLSDIISAIRWSAALFPAVGENGLQIVNPKPADVINLSLSIPAPCPDALQDAIDGAVSKGTVVVVAAGNDGGRAASYAPANCRNVVVVGAGNFRGQLTFYSNFGPEVDILAPGGNMYEDLDNDGRPDGVLSTKTTKNDCFDPVTKGAAAVCYYNYDQGTSMAAPHVAAALALLKAQYGVSGKALEDLLLTRAVAPIDANACTVDCARNSAATPIPGQPGKCMRACGRGQLDLTQLLAAGPAVAPAAPPTRRR
jgi:serine protease